MLKQCFRLSVWYEEIQHEKALVIDFIHTKFYQQTNLVATMTTAFVVVISKNVFRNSADINGVV